MALPEQGSKYSPMIDHLLAGLRQRGVLDRADHLVLRIGPHALDRLQSAGEMEIRMPAFLRGALGREMTASHFAEEWRRTAARARETLTALGKLEIGQHVPAMKIIAAVALGQDLDREAARDPKLARFLTRPGAEEWLPHLQALGCELPPVVVGLLRDLLAA